MSTRAMYGFKDEHSTHYVFVHMDGYPTGAADKFTDTLKSNLTWELPRFEANEFAAGFVAANKTSGGSVRLSNKCDQYGDIEYYYLLSQNKAGELTMEAYDVPYDNFKGKKLLFKGTLTDFIAQAAVIEEKMQA